MSMFVPSTDSSIWCDQSSLPFIIHIKLMFALQFHNLFRESTATCSLASSTMVVGSWAFAWECLCPLIHAQVTQGSPQLPRLAEARSPKSYPSSPSAISSMNSSGHFQYASSSKKGYWNELWLLQTGDFCLETFFIGLQKVQRSYWQRAPETSYSSYDYIYQPINIFCC